jgi:hypothetical protein
LGVGDLLMVLGFLTADGLIAVGTIWRRDSRR